MPPLLKFMRIQHQAFSGENGAGQPVLAPQSDDIVKKLRGIPRNGGQKAAKIW
jgi:hypothetical protein